MIRLRNPFYRQAPRRRRREAQPPDLMSLWLARRGQDVERLERDLQEGLRLESLPNRVREQEAAGARAVGLSDGLGLSSLDGYQQITSNRWLTRLPIFVAQWLYEFDGYCGELIGNLVDYGVGQGHAIRFKSEYRQLRWGQWDWSSFNKHFRWPELEAAAAQNMLLGGDIFGVKQRDLSGGMPRLRFIDPLHIWSNSAPGSNTQSGVVVNPDTGEPERYIYNPLGLPAGSVAERVYREIDAEDMIHIFRSEYSDQVRGLSWIRRSLVPLAELRSFHRLMREAAEQLIISPGYWSYNRAYADEVDETGDEDFSTEAQQKKVDERLRTLQVQDLTKWPVVPDGVEFHGMNLTGIKEGAIVEKIEDMILRRIARGSQVSVYALTADYKSGGMQSRQALQSDVRFYQRVQRHLRIFADAVVQWWMTEMERSDPRFAAESDDYTLTPSAFPYLDPLKDAQAVNVLSRLGVMTPQQVMRDRSIDWEQVTQEWRQFAEFTKTLRDDYEFTITGASAGQQQGTQDESTGPPELTDDEMAALGNDGG